MRTILTVFYLCWFLLESLVRLPYYSHIGKKDPVKEEALERAYTAKVLQNIGKLAGVRLKVEGLEKIPKEPVLYIGNHQSFFDVILTYPILPGRVAYIAKDDLVQVPVLPLWMKRSGCLFLKRDDLRQGMKVIMAACEEVKDGISMFIFPEGTRSKDGQVHEMKGGSFKVATKTGCPVVPVAISGTREIFEAQLPWLRPGEVTIRIGDPIDTKTLTNEEKKALHTRVQEEISRMKK